jgi:hypothetical protein
MEDVPRPFIDAKGRSYEGDMEDFGARGDDIDVRPK